MMLKPDDRRHQWRVGLTLILVGALLTPVLPASRARAGGPLEDIVRQALADLGLPAPLADDAQLDDALDLMRETPGMLHTLCVTSGQEENQQVVACFHTMGELRPDLEGEGLFEDQGYICRYEVSASVYDLHQADLGATETGAELLRVAKHGWAASAEAAEWTAAKLNNVAFAGGTIRAVSFQGRANERAHVAVWADSDLLMMATSKERAFLTVADDPSTLPCQFDAFRTDPTPEELIEALYRAAGGGPSSIADAAAGESEPPPTATPQPLHASCELSFNRNAPLIVDVRVELDGAPLSNHEVILKPSGEWEGAPWRDLVRLYDERRQEFVVGDARAHTDNQGLARLAAVVLYAEAPQLIVRGQPLRGRFGIVVEPRGAEGKPLRADCDVALDYVAVAHEPAWGPLRVYRYGEEEPAVAVAPGTYRTGAFPLYMGDRVVLGQDEVQTTEMQPGAPSPTLVLTYVDGTKAQFGIHTLQDERLEVRNDPEWHPARAEFMIGRTLERDGAGAVTYLALMSGITLADWGYGQAVNAVVVSMGPVGWKAAAITWAITTVTSKLLEAAVTERPTETPMDQCRPGRLYVPGQYRDVRLREPCGRLVGVELNIRSVVELEADPDGLSIRTHEGDPDVRDGEGNVYQVLPGQQLRVDAAGEAGTLEPFVAGEPWWDASLKEPLGQTSGEETYTWDVDVGAEAQTGGTAGSRPTGGEEGGLFGWALGVCACAVLALVGGAVAVLLARSRKGARQAAPPAVAEPDVVELVERSAAEDGPERDTWWVARGDEQYGPYTWSELAAAARAGSVHHNDWIHDPRTGRWDRASRYKGLLKR